VKRLFIGLIALFLAFGTVAFISQPAEAAQAKSTTAAVYLYRDYDALGGVDWAETQTGSSPIWIDCNAISFYRWDIPYPARITVSSIQLFADSQTQHCNYVGVYSSLSQTWYFQCAGIYARGYNFGWNPGGYYNDRIGYVDVRYNSSCGLYG
jgi:hypothetical protein